MPEELLSNDRRVEKHLPRRDSTHVIRTTELPIHNRMHWPLGFQSFIFTMLQPTL